MTSALTLMDRAIKRLILVRETGNVSEIQQAINELDAAGEIIVNVVAKRKCLECSPVGRIVK